jgi:NAD(P)-dependent dehydrogenase (short-subunit alcohol dehydrogenase family)
VLICDRPGTPWAHLNMGSPRSAGLSGSQSPVTPAHTQAAVNMITLRYAKAFPGLRINAVEPGFTATDLNMFQGTQTVEQGAEIIVRMAQADPDGPTGGYFDASGAIPW